MDAPSERRLAENEVIFRSFNEEAEAFIVEDAQDTYLAAQRLRFFCECSDLQCGERIKLTAEDFTRLHQNNRQFVLKPGHEVPRIERVIHSEPDFVVVEKYVAPPSPRQAIEPDAFA